MFGRWYVRDGFSRVRFGLDCALRPPTSAKVARRSATGSPFLRSRPPPAHLPLIVARRSAAGSAPETSAGRGRAGVPPSGGPESRGDARWFTTAEAQMINHECKMQSANCKMKTEIIAGC